MNPGRTRLAVLGKPIAHSRSPQIHAAAYRVLGLDWTYERVELAEEELGPWLDSRGPDWRGVSITMPLKGEALRQSTTVSHAATITGAVNTIVFEDGARRGYNTDVFGIVEALWRQGVTELRRVHVLGAGATATSVLAAAAQLGARQATVAARRPEQLEQLASVAKAFQLHVTPAGWTDAGLADLVVNTVPQGATSDLRFGAGVRSRAALLDVVYDPWPSPLAAQWLEAGGTVASGLDMLLWQAVLQIRRFLGLEDEDPLPREAEVVAAMQAALG